MPNAFGVDLVQRSRAQWQHPEIDYGDGQNSGVINGPRVDQTFAHTFNTDGQFTVQATEYAVNGTVVGVATLGETVAPVETINASVSSDYSSGGVKAPASGGDPVVLKNNNSAMKNGSKYVPHAPTVTIAGSGLFNQGATTGISIENLQQQPAGNYTFDIKVTSDCADGEYTVTVKDPDNGSAKPATFKITVFH